LNFAGFRLFSSGLSKMSVSSSHFLMLLFYADTNANNLCVISSPIGSFPEFKSIYSPCSSKDSDCLSKALKISGFLHIKDQNKLNTFVSVDGLLSQEQGCLDNDFKYKNCAIPVQPKLCSK